MYSFYEISIIKLMMILIKIKLEPPRSFELPTCWLQVSCSTNWAIAAWLEICLIDLIIYYAIFSFNKLCRQRQGNCIWTKKMVWDSNPRCNSHCMAVFKTAVINQLDQPSIRLCLYKIKTNNSRFNPPTIISINIIGPDDTIWTCDILLPKQVFYQAELHLASNEYIN